MILLLLCLLLITVVLYLVKINYEYWERRGVPGPKPTFLVGNLGPSFSMKKSTFEVIADIYTKYKRYPFVGFYSTTTPMLLICDPELIKDITIKYFNHFQDNDIDVDKDVDPLFGRNPFCLKGDEWKTVRTQLTPGFTSGKMKWIYPHLENISEQLANFIEKQPATFNGDGYEAKELCVRFTLNNVACCGFGIEGKCFDEENSEFRQIAREILAPGKIDTILFFLLTFFPALSKIIKFRFISRKIEKQLTTLVTETLKYREENNIVRNDFIHILQQLKKNCKIYEFTDIDVTAHATGLIDGYETSSIVMSFLLFELAANLEVQSKLRIEINQHFQKNNGKLPYDVIQNLPYLDGVVNETLRMHPPIFGLQKRCTKHYTYVPKDGDGIRKPVTIEKGTPIVFSLHGLHYDPRYFKDPKMFIPERFIGINKETITKYTFLPFGEGPRACLGQRFALLQIKTGVAYVIKNFELSVNKKTKLPLKYDPLNFLTTPLGGLWLDFKKIV